MNLESHYHLMNEASVRALQNDAYEIDSLIDSRSDNRMGITLLIRLNQQIIQEIQGFLSSLRTIEPDQYYYPDTDLHVTVLSVISCYEGFRLSNIHADDYMALLRSELGSLQKFAIRFRGVTLSKAGVLIKGFPDPTLNKVRDHLRGRFKASELQHSVDARYVLKTAHSTVMRFRKTLRNKQALIEMVAKNKNRDFGTMEVTSLELVYNDWYQRISRTQVLKSFDLS